MRALRHRERSRQEIDERLSRAGFGDEVRAEALDRLERLGYLDEGRFAVARAEAMAASGYGDSAIRADLERHRLGTDVLVGALDALVPERDRARAAVERLGRSASVARRLARKGFGSDSVEAAFGAALSDAPVSE